jgi:dihydropyrimidinase
VTDLVIRGGTVVGATGSRQADVAVEAGRIAAIEPDLGAGATAAREVVDAHGMLVLPGVVDVHTHTRVAADAEPDRFFQDSVAAAFGGTTTFLAFNNPGTGGSEAVSSSLLAGVREWRAATDRDSAVDYSLSPVLTRAMDDLLSELPSILDEGAPTAKAFMVYDFRLDNGRLLEAMRKLGGRGGLLEVHCEDPALLAAGVTAQLAAGRRGPDGHARSRPPYVEAVATHRALGFAQSVDAPVHVVHLSSAAALDEVRRAKAAGLAAFAETCPHYLTLTEDRYSGPIDQAVGFMISPPLRKAADRGALWAGLADGTLDLVATDHVPDRLAVEKAGSAQGVSFDQISNGAPGIETLLSLVYSEGVARRRISAERMVDLLSTTPARLFGMPAKGAIEVGRDADLVLFDPNGRRLIRASELHHTSDYTPYEGLEVAGAVRSVFVRGRPVIRAGQFVGQRGFGQFIERVAPFG